MNIIISSIKMTDSNKPSNKKPIPANAKPITASEKPMPTMKGSDRIEEQVVNDHMFTPFNKKDMTSIDLDELFHNLSVSVVFPYNLDSKFKKISVYNVPQGVLQTDTRCIAIHEQNVRLVRYVGRGLNNTIQVHKDIEVLEPYDKTDFLKIKYEGIIHNETYTFENIIVDERLYNEISNHDKLIKGKDGIYRKSIFSNTNISHIVHQEDINLSDLYIIPSESFNDQKDSGVNYRINDLYYHFIMAKDSKQYENDIKLHFPYINMINEALRDKALTRNKQGRFSRKLYSINVNDELKCKMMAIASNSKKQ